jgi:hypothetical protein
MRWAVAPVNFHAASTACSLPQLNWTEYFTLIYEGIENVTLHLEGGEDKIVVTNADYLKSLMKLLSETPSKTLGKYWFVIPFGHFRWCALHHCHLHLHENGKFKSIKVNSRTILRLSFILL